MSLPIILMYHSIDDRRADPDTWGLSVSLQRFVEQIEALASERDVVPLAELAGYCRAGRMPANLAAVTFDDGYANNMRSAKPVLERFGAPATLFLMTGAVDGADFWWDHLERGFAQATALPASLRLPIGQETLEIATTGDRNALVLTVWAHLRDLDTATRERAMAYLDETIGIPSPNTELRPATRDELERLGGGGILSLGAHTVSHSRLPLLSASDLTHEIAASKAICESISSTRVTTLAYPFGEHDRNVRSAVAAAGIAVACTTVKAPIRRNDECLALPRLAVGNWDGEELARTMSRLSDANGR